MACKNINPDVVDLLLALGACVNTMHNVFKVVSYKTEHKPERVVHSLLNHSSIRVWRGALPDVFLNAYDRLKITDDWVEAVSPEMFKPTPHSLQHLARWTLQNYLDGRVHKVVPYLDLPTFIKNNLLLEFRDYVH
ncbi:hypothetical protein J4Q44_G00188830 [Coregonus suidteri]|uniref:SOCS box domain-containing protein n=1 Tax=Coregonus suidteri TaxID=861788 RepID=A0AAN8LE61_9TELE